MTYNWGGVPISDVSAYGDPVPFGPGQTLSNVAAGRQMTTGGMQGFLNSALASNGISSNNTRPGYDYLSRFLNTRTMLPLYDLLQGGKETASSAGTNAQQWFDSLIAGLTSAGGNGTTQNVYGQLLSALSNPTGRLKELYDGMKSDQQISFLTDALKGAIGINTSDPYQQQALNNLIDQKTQDFAGMQGVSGTENLKFWDYLRNSGLLQYLSGL